MLEVLATPEYLPFSIAFVVMVGIGIIEAVGLSAGHFDLDADADVPAGTFLDWLGIGDGIPILVWLTSLLGCFTLSGIILQQISAASIGSPLHWGVASAGALVIGGIANSFAVAGLVRIMPTFESSAIFTEDLLMRRGTVLEGVATRGHPTRAKVVDQFGQVHYIMVEPHDDGDKIAQGETALLVRRTGPLFLGLPDRDSIFRAE